MCKHCDGCFGSRNGLFRHLKKFGLNHRDPNGSVEELPPSTDDGRQAGPVLHDHHRQGGPAKSKPRVQWADMASDEEEERAVVRTARWDDGEVRDLDMLSSQTQEDAMEVVRAKHNAGVDVGEIYSPPRVVAEAEAMGLRKGFSLDLTAKRADGKVWDFSLRSCQMEALQLVNRTKPFCVVGSPPCTPWSTGQWHGSGTEANSRGQRARQDPPRVLCQDLSSPDASWEIFRTRAS